MTYAEETALRNKLVSDWVVILRVRYKTCKDSRFKIQDLLKHLSGLQSKQHEVQLLQQLLHTCINKTKKQNEWEHTILHFRSIFQTPNSRCPFHTQTHAHVRHGHPSTHAQSHCNIYE